MSIILDTLLDGGFLSKVVPGFKSRPQQVEFAKYAANALVDGGILLAECPPGVGKSFGYSVPLIAMVNKTPTVERKKVTKSRDGGTKEEKYKDKFRALIVTANIALQEQLVQKDLPLLQQAMPFDFEFKLAKGRANYACYDFINSPEAEKTEFPTKELSREFGGLLRWARQSDTGDKNDLDYIPSNLAWAELVKNGDECKGKRCKNYKNCFVARARAGINRSNIVVCNYHLFFTHLAFGTTVLPEFDVVVMDEAHDAVDIARDIFGWQLTYYAIRRAAAPLRQIGLKDTRSSVLQAAKEFFGDLKTYKESKDYKSRLKKKHPVDSTFIVKQLKEAISAYEREEETKQRDYDNDFGRTHVELNRIRDRILDAKIWQERCWKLLDKIREAMELSAEECVYFIELDNRENAQLKCRTVDVSRILYERLFSRTKTVILTSATLAVRRKMDHIVNDLGIWRDDVKRLIVDSPFNLVEQTLCVIPEDAPSPDNSEGVANFVEQCVNAAGGRTLCLFTSYRNLAVTRDRLRERTTWNVLAQGDEPRTKLIGKFRADVRSVLLGVESFWAGIDVPGEALSCVVIDRIPFPTPDDPILDATKDAGGNWFVGYSIPRAVTTFRQGVGRLIRSIHDRGVVVILDKRVVRSRYGSIFMTSSFPRRMKICTDVKDIENFLNPIRRSA